MSRRKSHRQTFLRARIWLVVVFCVLFLPDLGTYLWWKGHNLQNASQVMGSVLVNLLWDLVLLGAMWMRMNWARYVMVTLLMLALVGGICFLATLQILVNANAHLLMIMAFWFVTRVIGTMLLIFNPSIRKLTSYAY